MGDRLTGSALSGHGCIHPLDHGLWRQRALWQRMLGMPVRVCSWPGKQAAHVWLGWGRKRSGRRAQRLARRDGASFLLLEDGLLRSFGVGRAGAVPLSVLVDDLGVHYDATRPSRLEQTLREGAFSEADLLEARRAIHLLRQEGLSKYNNGLPVPPDAFPADEERVLVVDQTAGDLSIAGGLATADTFSQMLEAALAENPHAIICVKTHPDVLAGLRKGCIPRIEHERVRWLDAPWHPHDVLAHFGKVYVVSSLMGLDALILGKEVHCFGMPFYAGWGLTHDRQQCERRGRRRCLEELVHAAFFRHARYDDPVSGRQGDFFRVADILLRQKRQFRFWAGVEGGQPWSGRVYAFGFRSWKHAMVRPFFGEGVKVRFVRSVAQARRKGITAQDRIAAWGMRAPDGLAELAAELNTPIVRVEDGFMRSVGLGSDFVPPISLVFDSRGIYFDPSRPSALEEILQTVECSEALLEEARALRTFIVKHKLTKYNLPRQPLPDAAPRGAAGRKVVLAPGQVEDDASIILGAGRVRTNLDLLRAAREEEPDAFIIYKPHPDVLSGNRKGRLHLERALRYCDHVETRADIISCIEAADTIHTMTSLSGFDALLRGRRVVCHGMPFYAGWGLTEDRAPIPRRTRRRSLDELVAAALILYPRYQLHGWPCAAGQALMHLAAVERHAAPPSSTARKLKKYAGLAQALWWKIRG